MSKTDRLLLDRCKSKSHRLNGTFQCEGLEGHHSVHFNHDVGWWPNKRRKLPVDLAFIILSLLAAAVIIWFVFL